MVEQGAASALSSRKRKPGRLRVTVRPYYEGPPFKGLVGTGGRAAKAAPILRWSVHPSGPESYGPERQKSPIAV